MSKKTGNPAEAVSQEDLQSIMTLQDPPDELVEIFQKKFGGNSDSLEPEPLDFDSEFVTYLERYKTTRELKQARERTATESAFPMMGLRIGSSSNWIALSLKKTKNIA